jgi:hypothetical protein
MEQSDAGGDRLRSNEFSKSTPVTLGEPPVTIESSPGHELDGNEVKALE